MGCTTPYRGAVGDHHRSPGATTRRGYGSNHQRLRAAWAPRVAAGGVRCHRDTCGELIQPGQAWDLGHVDGTGKRQYSGPEHASCNRRAGAAQARAPIDPPCTPGSWW